VYLDLIALLYNLNHTVEVGEVDIGRDTLGVKIQGKGDEVNIASSLTVTKEATLHSIGTSHLCQLSGSHCAATVIVRVEGNADFLALTDVAAEVLDLVSINVRGRHLNCGREVEDDGVIDRRLPSLLDRLANSKDKIGIRIGESLRAELKGPFCSLLLWVVLGQRSHKSSTPTSQLDTLLLGEVEDDPAEAFASGKIDVNNGLLSALQGLDCAPNKIFSARGKNLKPDIIWHSPRGLNQASCEIEISLGSRRKRHFDLFVAKVAEHLEVFPLLVPILHNTGLTRCP